MLKQMLTIVGTLFLLAVILMAAVPQKMNYQATLADAGGVPVTIPTEMIFTIWDADIGGTALWAETLMVTPAALGQVNLSLGEVHPITEPVLDGSATYLGIKIGTDPEIFPRTELITSAHAFHSAVADQALSVADDAITSFKILDGTITFSDIGQNGATSGQVMKWNGSAWTAADDETGGGGSTGWVDDGTVVRLDAIGDSLGIGTILPTEKLDVVGNIHASGTIISGNSITIDGVSDKITASSGTIDFDDENLVTTGKATIGPGNTNTGGDAFVAGASNTASGSYSTVGGGYFSAATGTYSTVGGGIYDTAKGASSTVGGGQKNTASGNYYSTVSGGYSNTASAFSSTVSGGYANTASGTYGTVGGGQFNLARGQYSVIAGGGGVNWADSNSAGGGWSAIGGGSGNIVAGDYSAIPGGYADTITATADYSYLFGIGSKLTEDSTFMVDMPHIRFGDEATGYEVPNSDGTVGQVLETDGSGQLSWTTPSAGAVSGWTDGGTVVRLDAASDSVGIGTTAPTEKLEVAGNIRVTGKANIGPNNTNAGNGAFVAGTNNTASGSHSTIGGGLYDTASSNYSSVGGGYSNVSGADYATVGGGGYNKARGDYSVVAGGGGASAVDSNSAGANYATVSGGRRNSASGTNSTVGGGSLNIASGDYSTVAGGAYSIASGLRATVGGGSYNKARGQYSVVAGGGGASVADSNLALGVSSAIVGGKRNVAGGGTSFVGGGYGNESGGGNAVIGGGGNNTADGSNAVIGGGYNNTASGSSTSIGGGQDNVASNNYGTVGGGRQNAASGYLGTIGGGYLNTSSQYYSTVGGGYRNTSSQQYSTVGGGGYGTASGSYSTVAGGASSTASGDYAMVPGGYSNKASGNYSFAAGRRANAIHNGTFVWADQTSADFSSSAINQFSVRASGGTRIYSNSALSAGVTLAAGGSSWSAVSDSTLKENIRPVNGQDILDKLAQMPISRWNYKAQNAGIEHVGPMAQDFYRLFGLGEDDKHINTLDPDGIALAAIKGLYEKTKQLENKTAEIDELKEKLSELTVLVQTLLAERNEANAGSDKLAGIK